MIDNRITIKVGSNVLTRPDGTLDTTRMSAIVDQLTALRRQGMEVILVSSGAVAAGRGVMHGSQLAPHDAVAARQLYSAVGQVRLINRYYELMQDHGIVCGQVLTTKESLSTRAHYLNQKHCMEALLECGVMPIVNENDTISVTELMFTDNDELAGLVASMMDASRLIILSNIDGVYDGDPANPASRVIADVDSGSRVNPASFVKAGKSSFGRGGMDTKFRMARKVADEGIEVTIANGRRDGILLDVVGGNRSVPFTVFHRAGSAATSMKKWIAHSEDFAKGAIHVNEGAQQALLSATATSLLPIGVTSVEGNWEKNDIVRVVAPGGKTIGYGRVACDSAKAAAVAGSKGGRPLIHYDYLYIDE